MGDWVPAVCSYMYMSSQISIWEEDRPSLRRRAWLNPELSALVYEPPEIQSCQAAPKSHARFDLQNDNHQIFHGGKLRPRQPISNTLSIVGESYIPTSYQKVQSASVNDVKRWQLATEAVKRYPPIAARLKPGGASDGSYDFLTEELVMESSANWPAEDFYEELEA